MGMRSRAAPALAAAVLTLGIADAEALSLRSSRAEAFLGDVRPGESASFSGSAGAPLTVENTGRERVTLEAYASIPPPSKLRDGYEPLPDLKWLRLTARRRELSPGETAELDMTVTVPRERVPWGAQYQFDCLLRGRSPGGGAVDLRTVALVAVGEPDPPRVPPEPDVSGFSVSPARIKLEGVPLGRSRKATLKLVNAGEEELTARLVSVREWDESVRIEDGWTPAPNPRWLRAPPPLTVAAGEVKDAELELEIPAQERYRGRSWAFVVAVDAAGKGREGRTWRTLYVRTE